MQQPPKIGILCNSALGIPSIHALLTNKLVAAIGMPNLVHNNTADIQRISEGFGFSPQVFSKADLKSELTAWIQQNQLDIVLVFTFPWKIAADVLSLPRLGFVNFHFGLLPEYRGADAIFWTIKKQSQFGGISVHQMDNSFDTGALMHVERVTLLPTDTYGMHSAKLASANVQVLQKLLPAMLSGQMKTTIQKADDAIYYKKPTIADIRIQWATMNVAEIVALVNACNPWNKGAYTMLNDMPLRVAEAAVADKKPKDSRGKNGEILGTDNGIQVQCVDGVLNIKVVVIEEGIFNASSFALYCGIIKGLIFNNIDI